MGESHVKNTRGKLFFWFSLQGGCGGSKRVSFFSLVCHMNKNTRDINLCFGLVGKVVVEVQRSSILFTYMGAPHVQKIRGLFFLFNFLIFFHEFMVFIKDFVLICAMER
jgi:hypothetical protein